MQIDHADFDHIVRRRRAMLETDLVAEDEAVIGRKLQLVVVPEPVKSRPARNLARGRKGRWRKQELGLKRNA
ncbi:MAG: hypothetical protein B7Z55_13390 [Planctomycetales bacterium 12-60-4]|nr:MAG: hypothetical protein B7Z55_13390 [Planctomycetales bacterium 12-60-4]